MRSFADLNSGDLVHLLHLILILAVIYFFRRVLKRPFIRLFHWKYFTSENRPKHKKER
jgi:hypothetical protein